MSGNGKTLVVCARCGGHNVQVLDWVDANLDMLIGGEESPPPSSTWCEDCDDNSGIECVEVEPAEYRRRCQERTAKLADGRAPV